EHPDVAGIWNNIGGAWDAKKDHDKAIQYFKKALASDLKTFGPDHPSVARNWNNLGLSWKMKGQYDKAIGYYEKALAIVEKANLSHRVKLVKENIAALKNQR
ncbi:MAG: tetratricopeptide repeat protein, partial [Nitrospinae bacterium]|nr:tetratricopeptide repeat protein [Nitrospinota bacterium]